MGRPVWPTPKLVLLADNADISPLVFERLVALRRRLVALTEGRNGKVDELNLDPRFCLPAGNWSGSADNDFQAAFIHISDGDFDVLNRLRFWCQTFTGYQVMTLSPGAGLRSVNPIPPNYDQWLVEARSEPDEWVAHWQTITRHLPRRYIYSPPRMLGEVGWEVNNVVVNHDTCAYQERINLLYESGVLKWLEQFERPRILEIGGGYGALSHVLTQILPKSLYVICDLPESLMFSGLYLAAISGVDPLLVSGADDGLSEHGATLIPNYLFHLLSLRGLKFDLVVNTLSMSEMSEYQVQLYADGISKMVGTTGVFFEQNQDNRQHGMLDAKALVIDHFKNNLRIADVSSGAIQGAANLWSNGHLDFLKTRCT